MEPPHLPRVNPIGLFETPPDFPAEPRRFSRRSRLLAAALLSFAIALFQAVLSDGH